MLANFYQTIRSNTMSSNSLFYKGYAARIEFNAENDYFVGHIVGITDKIEFFADNVSDLKLAFVKAIEDYLKTCKKVGKDPTKYYSGKLMLRMVPEVHKAIAKTAQLSGMSINQWAAQVLSKEAIA
jgi:predicted HicB family RNase H-like nuclease